MGSRPMLAVLHSHSQVFFQAHWATGLLFVLAFAVADAGMALFALIGAAVQSVLSWIVPGIDGEAAMEGKHGFCGALTGAAAYAALGFSLPALAWAVVGAAACVGLVLLMSSRPVARWGLPAMTAPFCLVSGIAMLATRSLQTTPAPPVYTPTGSLADPLLAVLTSISQVVLLDNVWSGALILLGLFLAGWRVGVWALAGAVIASAIGWALTPDGSAVVNGLEGYSGVLVALALGTVFLHAPRRFPVAIVGIALTVPVQILLARTGIPVYTWPFVLVTWGMLLLDRGVIQRYVLAHLPSTRRPVSA